MPHPLSVTIYGNTLALAGLAVALKNRPDLDLAFVPEDIPDEQWSAASPDVVLFDRSSNAPPVLDLMIQNADFFLIGVDANDDRVSVWTRCEIPAVSVQDLIGTINRLYAGSVR